MAVAPARIKRKDNVAMDGQRFDQITRTMARGASRRRVVAGLAAAVAGAAGLRAGSITGLAAAADVCPGLGSGKIDVADGIKTVHVCASDGLCITSYCVKAGSVKGGTGGPVTITVDPPTHCVDIVYPTGKDISHYSYSEGPCPPPPVCDECKNEQGTAKVLCYSTGDHANKCCPVVASPCGRATSGEACCGGGDAGCEKVDDGQICNFG